MPVQLKLIRTIFYLLTVKRAFKRYFILWDVISHLSDTHLCASTGNGRFKHTAQHELLPSASWECGDSSQTAHHMANECPLNSCNGDLVVLTMQHANSFVTCSVLRIQSQEEYEYLFQEIQNIVKIILKQNLHTDKTYTTYINPPIYYVVPNSRACTAIYL